MLKITCSSARKALRSSHCGKAKYMRHFVFESVSVIQTNIDEKRIELRSFDGRKRPQFTVLMRADFERPAVNCRRKYCWNAVGK